MRLSDDEQCIQKVLSGNVRAYAKLVDKYQALAYTLAFRVLAHEQEAEEVAQDAFVKAYQALDKYQGAATFSTWLYRIVYNTALSRLRKKKLTTTSIDELYHLPEGPESTNSFQTLVQQDRRLIIERALRKLPPEEATLIDLYYIQEKTAEEIRTITGLTNTNLRTKLFRARKKLYGYLQKMLKNGKEDVL